MLPRTIQLDRATHTPDLDPSWNGESIGTWNGDVLTVDTKGFNDRFAKFNLPESALRPSYGLAEATVYGCDLSAGYVRINADYTT